MANEINEKKYASLESLRVFKENLEDVLAEKAHTHSIDELVDYVVDAELSATSINPVQNKILNAEFEAVSNSMGALELVIDEMGAYIFNIDYNTLAFDTTEIVFGTGINTTAILGQATLDSLILA